MSKILVVDDDRSVLNYFKLLLTQQGRFELRLLNRSGDAFAVIDSGGFDVLLLDMDMPNVTGREILRHVREHHPEVQVIVITGVVDVPLAVESMKMGAFDYLSKPVDGEALVSTIDRALEHSASHRAGSRLQEGPDAKSINHVVLRGLKHKDRSEERR